MARWGRFLLQRVVRVVIVSVVLITATFVTVRLVPGDPAQKAIGMQTDRSPEEQAATLEQAKRDLHLDRSLPVQYAETLGAAATFDFGRSFQTNQQVTSIIGDRLGSTLRLAAGGTLVMLVIGGRQSVWGPLIGAAILTPLPELLRGAVQTQHIFYGAALILILHFLPGGLASLPARVAKGR